LNTAAIHKLYFEFDVQGSISAFESLIRRYPSSTHAYVAYRQALAVALKTEEMLVVAERLLDLDPHSTITAVNELLAHFAVGDFDRARGAANRIPLEPVGGDCWSGRRCWLVDVDIPGGRFDAAQENINESTGQYVAEVEQTYQRIWLAIERGELDIARALYASTPNPKIIGYMPFLWLALDVVLTEEISRTLDEIENPTTGTSIIWIMRLPFRDRWMSEHGAPVFQEAFAALQKSPRYQQALQKYGIDDATLANIQVHTDELWD
jgi:hypothetical protein